MKRSRRKELTLKDLRGFIVCTPEQRKEVEEQLLEPLRKALKSVQFVRPGEGEIQNKN